MFMPPDKFSIKLKQHVNNFSRESLLEMNRLSNKLTNKSILKVLMIKGLVIIPLPCNHLLIQ